MSMSQKHDASERLELHGPRELGESWMGHLSESGEDCVSQGYNWSSGDPDNTDQIRCSTHYALPRLLSVLAI